MLVKLTPELLVDPPNRPPNRVCRPASLATFRRVSIPFLADHRHLCDAVVVVVVERAVVRRCRPPSATRMDLSTLSWSVSTNKQGERGDGAVVVVVAGVDFINMFTLSFKLTNGLAFNFYCTNNTTTNLTRTLN